jgi:hypothetical protein
MGQVIKTRTITEDQLEALKIYCFTVNSVKQAEAMLKDAQEQFIHAKEWLAICRNEIRTARDLIPYNLDAAAKQFEISDLSEEDKSSRANRLINIYLDHPSGEIPTLGEIKQKRNVIVRSK